MTWWLHIAMKIIRIYSVGVWNMHNGKITPIQYVLEFTPLEFETGSWSTNHKQNKIRIYSVGVWNQILYSHHCKPRTRLEFTPLEFETSKMKIWKVGLKLEFTPLEFETTFKTCKTHKIIYIRIYSVGVWNSQIVGSCVEARSN